MLHLGRSIASLSSRRERPDAALPSQRGNDHEPNTRLASTPAMTTDAGDAASGPVSYYERKGEQGKVYSTIQPSNDPSRAGLEPASAQRRSSPKAHTGMAGEFPTTPSTEGSHNDPPIRQIVSAAPD